MLFVILGVDVALFRLVLGAEFFRVEPLVAIDDKFLVVDEGRLEAAEEYVILLELVLLHLGQIGVLKAAEPAIERSSLY